MRYGELISQAFRISWRNRYLWFFGVFAGTSGPSFNFNFPSGSDSGGGSFHIEPGVVIAAVLLLLLLVLAFMLLGTIAQGGLTDSVAALARGEPRDFRTTWRAGLSRFWRVLGYGALIVLIVLALVFAIVMPLVLVVIAAFVFTDAVVLEVLVIVLAALLVLVVFAVGFFVLTATAQLGLRDLVLRGPGVVEALGRGWRLFRANLGSSLLLVLIQQGIGIGAGIVVGIALVIVALPTIILAVGGATAAAIVVGILTGVVVVPLALAAFGAIGTFNHAFWTLAYLRLPPLPA